MSWRQIPTAIILSCVLVLAVTAGVVAKGDAIVTLDASLPADPEPGSEITVGWTVETLGENDARYPLNAEGMFIRLIPANGEPVEAVGAQDPLGHYVATITVPGGGIEGIEVGLRGESCSGGTCQRSDILFVIDDSMTPVFAPAAPEAAAVAGEGADSGTAVEGPASATSAGSVGPDLVLLGLIGLAVAAAASIMAGVVIRNRGRTVTPGSSRP